MSESQSEFGDLKEFLPGTLSKPLNSESLLVGSKCQNCGKVFFPKKRLCTNCYTWDKMEETTLSKKGKIFSWTVSSMYGLPPIPFGYVDLPEGIRLFTQFTDCDPCEQNLNIGMDVEMVVQKMWDQFFTKEFVGYKFKPIKKEET
ncbi:MAG: Zn-ribbon domain-containing OB-fold protein [Candidatus Lokiarchaeia archaeon]